MLKVENLSVNYGYITALSEISFHVDQGEIITLIGSNGAGKTTSLHAISGLVHKAGGSVQFKGTDISRMAPDKIVKMGMCHVPEGRKIFPALSVYENLIAGSLGNPKLSKNRIQELLEEQYKLFPRLKERLTQAGGSLSGGEQQMLAISRGLMMDPDIVMLDEPSLGLAPIIVEGIFDLILQIRDMGKTILLIEQNASMALSIADRGYVLETGKIIMEGKGKDLLTDPRVKAAYLGA
ncbi:MULTISPECIES: ABC transporter ATP-binding protein [Eubacteriales]|jgi:branched-chain amino acid transport system ATP-binding protein|uniref:ABC transporter ATP-binding protein n=1 Tax=Clostridia TaxID=186801 RepID=UPI000E4DD3DA|nr:ABC transporter ATP-binding protein [Clostridium sp. AM33-3]RHT23163.1 ABC transporter ATP-binding protein [Clostridium sp. AM33-3]